jgi:predicted ATP-dependent protease
MSKPLSPEKLRRRVSPDLFGFESTADIPALLKPLGQERALRAMRFGLEIASHGYNLFVLGQPGAGKQSTVTAVLDEIAKTGAIPEDWCYVFNFAEAERPLAISLPAGSGEAFRDDINTFVTALRNEVPKAFSTEAYAREKTDIIRQGQEQKNIAFQELETLANEHNFLVQRSADGLTLIYTRNGEPLNPEEFDKLSEEDQKEIQHSREIVQEKLRDTILKVKQIDRELHESVRTLDARVGLAAVGHEIEALEQKYNSFARVVEYLNALKEDVLKNIDQFRGEAQETPAMPFPFLNTDGGGVEETLKRYRVNLLVNNKDRTCAPVVFESNPSYHNLVGRIENRVQYGAFVTDYTMIKAGAFHNANGGYLVLNAREVLLNPFAYEVLKRVLKDQEIRMEEIGEQYRMIATQTLKPEPIPARLKVILLGTPWIYYLLQDYDEDFYKLFKVKGEFAHEMEFSEDNRMSYAYLIANQCSREGLLPFDRGAVAQVVEHGMRLADSQKKLSTEFLEITDLVRESHHWAGKEGKTRVEAAHIKKAIDEKIYRSDYLEELIGEMIEDGTILIDVTGSVAGQLNGLSVYEMGDYAFGKPSRVTARVFLGKEGVTNIERESDLGGRIHNKGVLILQGFFGARYAQKVPLSFGATLCFEQSYGGVEGDSASGAELFALVSAISGVPLRQDLAVTGSVSQMGQIQAVGGINLKIEGFYKTCKVKGITGTQGVVIPESNTKHLMLRDEVVEAVERGEFHIYPISTVDEGLELLTGMKAGDPDDYGDYPKGTLNARVVGRLERFAAQWRKAHGE